MEASIKANKRLIERLYAANRGREMQDEEWIMCEHLQEMVSFVTTRIERHIERYGNTIRD